MRTGPKVWVPSGTIVNPIDGQILVDSGLLAAGSWLFGLVGQTDSSLRLRVLATVVNSILAERRPAAGDIDLLIPNHQPLVLNERIQVLCVGAVAATLQLTLHGVLVE